MFIHLFFSFQCQVIKRRNWEVHGGFGTWTWLENTDRSRLGEYDKWMALQAEFLVRNWINLFNISNQVK